MRFPTILSTVMLVTLAAPAVSSAHGLGSLALAPLEAKVRLQAGDGVKREVRDEKKGERAEREGDDERRSPAIPERRNRSIEGTVTAISGNDLTLKLGSGETVVVHAADAKLVRRFGAEMAFGDIQVNDKLAVEGRSDVAGQLTAKSIRDLSLQARNGTFVGNVVSADANAKSFVITTKNRGQQTIYVNDQTKVSRNGASSTFATIAAGQEVRVDGVWDRANGNVTAKVVRINVPLITVHFQGVVTIDDGKTIQVAADTASGTTRTVDLSHSSVVFSTYRRMGAAGIQVGDRVDVWGRSEAGSANVAAYFVRDLSQVNAKTQTVTRADNGATVTLNVGDRLVLRLGDGYAWSNASSGNVSVLATTALATVFEAKSAGSAELSMSGDPVCRLATPACASPSMLFRVSVNVLANAL